MHQYRIDLDFRDLAASNHELVEQTNLRATEDFKEGVKATAERRIEAASYPHVVPAKAGTHTPRPTKEAQAASAYFDNPIQWL